MVLWSLSGSHKAFWPCHNGTVGEEFFYFYNGNRFIIFINKAIIIKMLFIRVGINKKGFTKLVRLLRY